MKVGGGRAELKLPLRVQGVLAMAGLAETNAGGDRAHQEVTGAAGESLEGTAVDGGAGG